MTAEAVTLAAARRLALRRRGYFAMPLLFVGAREVEWPRSLRRAFGITLRRA